MIELTFPKELKLIKQVNQKGVIFVILNKGFKFQPNVCNESHDLLMMSINLSDIAVLYCCFLLLIITVLLTELAKVRS